MKQRERLLIVDGYNVLNQWRSNLDGQRLSDGREALVDALQNYAGFTGQRVVVVYDGWQTDRLTRTEESRGPVKVVYTRKGETADHYIERLCDARSEDAELGLVEIRVATSDRVEQLVALGRGATRVSAREILMEMETVQRPAKAPELRSSARSMVRDGLPEDIRKRLEEMITKGRDSQKRRK